MRRSSGFTTISMWSSISGITNTDANDVWRRACWSNGEIRTSRCTPLSPTEHPVGILALDLHRRGFDARFFAWSRIEDVGAKAFVLGPAEIHPQKHFGPILRFGAAGARLDGENRVQAVVFAGREAFSFRAPRRAHRLRRFLLRHHRESLRAGRDRFLLAQGENRSRCRSLFRQAIFRRSRGLRAACAPAGPPGPFPGCPRNSERWFSLRFWLSASLRPARQR